MSARNPDPTAGATRNGIRDAQDGRLGRGVAAGLVAITAVGLVPILLLLAVPDDHGIPNAAARAGSVSAPRSAVDHRRPKLSVAEVRISPRAGLVSVPDAFLGLSTEYWGVPLFERHKSLFERVLSLVHVRGDGPLILRIGGNSADQAFWDPRARRTLSWAFELTPGWLRRTGILVHRARIRLILDLNLVTGSPLRAAQWARAAETHLPRGSIAGFEIGNEPDIYSRSYWLATISRTTLDASFLPSDMSANTYTQDFQSYARALARAAPGVPLAGPAIAEPGLDVNWISSLITGARPELGIVSAHRYPFSACVPRSSATYPTIARLLSQQASAGVAQSVKGAVRLAHQAGLVFRLTELNSVTCGGVPGLSDAFATALWAPDALFELLQAGVDGVNVHVRARAINAAFTLSKRGLVARPLLYGLILFARTLGPDAQLIHLRLHVKRSLHLKVWAVRVRGGTLRVLLIDKGNHPVRVHLQLPTTGPATLERLLAPSIRSRSGVTLDGQQLRRDGRWRGRPVKQTIPAGAHEYQLTIPQASAALLSVHLRPRALMLNTLARNG
jgi:hypothetical protein